MFTSEMLYKIIQKCNGPIDPLGDSSVDGDRLDNLETVMDLCELMLRDIESVARDKGDHRGSIARAGKVADEFLREIRQE
jgi:hypothetical protein